jgi:hypothetical protein
MKTLTIKDDNSTYSFECAKFEIIQGTPAERNEVSRLLVGLDELSPEIRAKVITAWVTTWKNSSFASLNDVPNGSVRMIDHVNEVVRFGMALGKLTYELWGAQWKQQVDWHELMQVLILHDLDKPLIYDHKRSSTAPPVLHGVSGAIFLNELEFSENVVTAVAMHSPMSPFHLTSNLLYILHYVDLLSLDHSYILEGREALYQKHSALEGAMDARIKEEIDKALNKRKQ